MTFDPIHYLSFGTFQDAGRRPGGEPHARIPASRGGPGAGCTGARMVPGANQETATLGSMGGVPRRREKDEKL